MSAFLLECIELFNKVWFRLLEELFFFKFWISRPLFDLGKLFAPSGYFSENLDFRELLKLISEILFGASEFL